MTTYVADDWIVGQATWGTDVDLEEDTYGSITAFADAGGGQVTVTSVGHSVLANMAVVIRGTTSYNGTFVATNITADTFEITDTWVANDATGTWLTSKTSDAFVLFENTTPAADPYMQLDEDMRPEVEEGMPYTAVCIAEADSIAAGNTVELQITWYDANQVWISNSVVRAAAVLSAVGTWETLAGIANAPEGARFGTPTVVKNNTAFHLGVDTLGINPTPVGFSAYLSSDTGYATGATIVFDTEEYDDGSNYDTSTGIFTAPSSGRYIFNAQAEARNFSAGKYGLLLLYQGGAAIRNGGTDRAHATNDDLALIGSWILPLSRGDQIKVVASHNNGGSPTFFAGSGTYRSTMFTGFKVGG